jgi:hypothetical protein
VLAVPRSTANSLAGSQDLRLVSFPRRAWTPFRKAWVAAAAGLMSMATVTVLSSLLLGCLKL